jgi:hypothetical protein
MKAHPILAFAVAAAALSFAAGAAGAGPNIIVFDPPDAASGSSTSPNSLSKKGEISGAYADSDFHFRGYLREKDGSFLTVGDAGDQPFASNDKRVVTGVYVDREGRHGYVVAADGSIARFDAPGTKGKGLGTEPVAIDRKGEVVGIWGTGAQVRHGFLRDPGGTITSFDAPGAGTASGEGTFVAAVNAKGTVAGYDLDGAKTFHGFLRAANGTFTRIDAAGAGNGTSMGTQILALSNKGAVSGIFLDANGSHGFVIDAHGSQTTFDLPNRQNMLVTGMNSQNDIVGYYADNSLGIERGFVRANSGDLTVFNVAVDDQSTFADDINDKGEISGFYLDSAGVAHSWLRTP